MTIREFVRRLGHLRGPMIAPLVLGGLALGGGMLGKAGRDKRKTVTNTSTSSTDLNPYGQNARTDAWQAALDAFRSGAPGMTPGLQSAMDAYGQFGSAGNLGLQALTGDASALKSFTSPYQQQVIDATNAQYDHADKLAQNAVKSNATAVGAFGGSRQAVAQGVAAANVARDRNSAVSDVINRGYGDAMQRAMQSANLGFGAAQGQAQLGQFWQEFADPQRRAGLLAAVMGQLPWGQTASTTSTGDNPGHQNPWSAFLGGALTTGGLFGGGMK